MRYFSILLIFVSFNSLHGQTYDTKMIIAKADSILKQRVGDTLYQYFKYDKNSYYEYQGFKNESNWKALVKGKKTKGKFVNTDVRFYLDYPFVNGIRGTAHIQLNSDLNLVGSIPLDFVPEFLLKNKKCDFMSKEKALEIAKDSLKYKGIDKMESYLEYESKYKRYVYTIHNILTKQTDSNGRNSGESETLKIDAITGKILDHWKGEYGYLD
jgi:hypothetical protein